MDDIILTADEAKGILASIALADHVGDCMDAVSVLAHRMGYYGRIDMEGLAKANMIPEYLKD
jgi:hypothetical protein